MIRNDIEDLFVKTFITREFRKRWQTRLASAKTRHKLLNRLAHTLTLDLDQRYIYDKDAIPVHIAPHIQHAFHVWKQSNPTQQCHIIAASSERDGQMMALLEAETDYQLTFGAIIILIADHLAYYHTERSNLSRQPFYVLFRP